MFFQICTSTGGTSGDFNLQSIPLSPIAHQTAAAAVAGAAMNLSPMTSLISPYYPLGHLPTAALYLPSLLGNGGGPFVNGAAGSVISTPVAACSGVPAQHRKLFIGGLNHDTSDEQLRDYYSQWGQVVDCIVIRDPITRHSRGFGFITFATTEMADAAMADRPHTIGGKIVDPKRAIPREQMLQAASYPPAFLDAEPPSECKLVLSGVHWDFHTVDILRHYFERFGELEQVEIVGHSGFGFIAFEERSGVKKCLAQGKWHLVNGRKVGVQEADGENNSDSLSPPYRPPAFRNHRKRNGKAGNSLGSSNESQSHSPESTQSETDNSN